VIILVSRLSLSKFSHMLEESDVDHNVSFLEGPGVIGIDIMAKGPGILNASTGIDGGLESPLPLLLPKGEWDTVEQAILEGIGVEETALVACCVVMKLS